MQIHYKQGEQDNKEKDAGNTRAGGNARGMKNHIHYKPGEHDNRSEDADINSRG